MDSEVITLSTSKETTEFPLGISITIDFSRLTDKERRLIPEALYHIPKELDFNEGLNLIVGLNGAGKTTLSQGIYFAASGTVPKSDVSNLGLLPAIALSHAVSVSGDYDNIVKFDGAVNMKDPLSNGKWAHLSQRQSKDAEWKSVVPMEQRKMTPLLAVFDEFETGMDPWRHANIAEELQNFLAPRSTLLVATNSPILLANESLPRIDLRFPEKGLHLPTAH